MSEQKRDGPEPYSKKLMKYAWQGTWHFSKQQIIFSSILGIIAAPIAYALGLAPSVGLGILAVFIVSAIAFFLAGFYHSFEHQRSFIASSNRRSKPCVGGRLL